MREMLKKGDAMLPKYANFNYEELDSSQIGWINRLTWFTRMRPRIETYFRESKVSNDLKLLFIEQHSMKLGDRVFYEIES